MRARLLLAALAVVVLLPGCAVRGLSFFQDDRVSILEPQANETVKLPFDVRWLVSDFDGFFAIFFDRSPMAQNQTMLAVVPEEDPCRSDPGCPDAQWLAERDIYITRRTRLVVEKLPDLRLNERSKDRHDLTIVLLDEDGRRIGESTFTREFVVVRGEVNANS